ncbi:hypothetical protein Ahia01_000950800, partial [Argonauta hians]
FFPEKKFVDVVTIGKSESFRKYFSIKIKGNNTLIFVRTYKSQVIPEMTGLLYFKDPEASTIYPIQLSIYPKPNCTVTQIIKEILLQTPFLQVNCRNISQRQLLFKLRSVERSSCHG